MTKRAWVLVAAIWAAQIATAEDAEVAKLVAALPGKPPEQSRLIIEQLVKTGDSGVRAIIGMLKEPGKGDDSAERTALHALAVYAGAPGHRRYRDSFVEAVGAARVAEKRPERKAQLLAEYVAAGGGEMLPQTHPDEDDATGAVARAGAALHLYTGGFAMLPEWSSETPVRPSAVHYLQALADSGIATKAGIDTKVASYFFDAPATDVRIVARRTAASLGIIDPVARFFAGTQARDPFERRQAIDAALLIARRFEGTGDVNDAELVHRRLWQIAANESQARCAILWGWSRAAGPELLPELLKVVETDSADVRAVALEIGRTLPSRAVGRAWLKHVSKVPPDVGAQILDMLGRRGDSDVLDGVLELTRSENATLRHAAIAAVPGLGAENVVGPLVALLSNDADRSVAEAALGRVPGQQATALMAEALGDAAPPAKVALLRALAVRRATAQQDYIVAALEDPSLAVRIAALETLASVGNARALRATTDRFTKASDPAERTAAKKAVSLLALTEPDPAKRAAALERVKEAP